MLFVPPTTLVLIMRCRRRISKSGDEYASSFRGALRLDWIDPALIKLPDFVGLLTRLRERNVVARTQPKITTLATDLNAQQP